ncbi:MAG: helix-turn-helix domain-containing protein [Nitriliruptoraceae bacterium]
MHDLRDSLTADVAAERLGRSPHEVRRLARTGQVCAHRRAGRWLVPLSEIRRLQRLPLPVGRPFSPSTAWALLTMLSGAEPAGLSAPRRSQLRRHLLDAEIEELAARLGRRASRRFVYAHPSKLQALTADPRVVLTGLAVAERAGARLVAADDDDVEGYVAESDVAALHAGHGLIDAGEVANVVLHVVDDEVEIPVRGESAAAADVAAAPVVGLDLWESGDARAYEEGQRLFVDALEAFRGR